MGRIKTRKLKSVTKELFSKYDSDFNEDFQKNKEIVMKRLSIKSKKLKNIISGYATRLKRSQTK
jgi:ribosomal protein S17E